MKVYGLLVDKKPTWCSTGGKRHCPLAARAECGKIATYYKKSRYVDGGKVGQIGQKPDKRCVCIVKEDANG